jgi:UDP-N-acetyl-D-mannosaminuronic acid dehydrogenase
MSKIEYDLCVVGGAGHVGLPFALVFANLGLNVVIYDINVQSLNTISCGVVPFLENGAEPLLKKVLASNCLHLSSDPDVVSKASTVIITIGTPVDEFLNPVFKDIRSSFEKLLPYLHDDQLLILRSTVYPGTTIWLDRFLKERNKTPLIAFCPERIVQGKAVEEILDLPQIVSGTTPAAEDAAAKFFEQIHVEIVRLAPMEAEFAKLFSNTYRYISFAITNQFYMIANSAGLDYERILKGVKFHYPRLQGLVGPGFAAGPCLFKDTMQLNAYAKNEFVLGQAAMNVNEGLVLYLMDRLCQRYDLPNCTVGLLGMAFKPNNDDIRASLSYKLKKLLQFKAKAVLTTDPYVTRDLDLLPLDDVIDQSDFLILCVPHSDYHDLCTTKTVIDFWGFLGNGVQV